LKIFDRTYYYKDETGDTIGRFDICLEEEAENKTEQRWMIG